MAEQLSRPLARLASVIDPVILAAPHTAGDTRGQGHWPDVHLQTVSYLERNAVATPWRVILIAKWRSAWVEDRAGTSG